MKNFIKSPPTALMLLLALLLPTLIPAGAQAQDQEAGLSEMPENPWKLDLTLWLALPFIDGDTTLAGSETSLSLVPKDLFDNADTLFAAQGRIDLWYDNRFGLIAESMGSLMKTEQTFSRTPTLPAIPAAGVKTEIEWESVFVDFMAAYRVYQGPLGDSGMTWRFDATAGMRYTHLKQTADFTGLGILGLTGSIGSTEDWIEPIVGGQFRLIINDKWSVDLHGNVGGFGIDNASDLSWRLGLIVGYKINHRLTLLTGYQAYGLDYDNGEAGRGHMAFDGVQHGPGFGLTISF